MTRFLFVCALLMLVGTCAGNQEDERESIDEVSLNKMIAELSGKAEDDTKEDEDAKKEKTVAKDEEDADTKEKDESVEDEQEDEEGPEEEPKDKDDSEEKDDVKDDSKKKADAEDDSTENTDSEDDSEEKGKSEDDSEDKSSSVDSAAAKADDGDDSGVQADDKDDSGAKVDDEETKKDEPKADSGIDFQLVKEVTIPIVAFAIGVVLHQSESTAVYGKLAMFFGAQTVMNLYMKQVLSGSVVDEEKGLKGVPSAFIVTALQQLVAFIVFGIIILILLPTPYAYTPKKLETKIEVLAVVLFSFSFTMNIALNNFSISLLPLSVNLIIRSCLPLATFITQRTASKCTNEPVKDARAIELLFMVLGVCCAIIAVIAKSHVSGKGNNETKTLAFGIIICVASLFSGAINLALAGVLGTSCKLNSLDTTVYMSIPAFLFLIPPSLFYWHPVSWPGFGSVTDREIFMVVLHKKPSVIGLAAFSGVLAFFYNVFQYGIVHSLSASYTAFAGNFNKAATIALGLILGIESLPPGVWGIVMICACVGNIGAFTAFNIVKMRAKHDEVKPKESEGEEKSNLINKA